MYFIGLMDGRGKMGVEEVIVLRYDLWRDDNGGELGVVLVECKVCECRLRWFGRA